MNSTLLTKVGGLAAAATLALGLAACGNAPAEKAPTDEAPAEAGYELVADGKLTVVAELGFAPFEYMDAETGEPVGFDVDVAKEVAKRLGLECEYLPNQKFDTLVPTIKQGGKADISIAAITISDERIESVDFTDPYLDSNQAIVVRADSTETEESLNAEGKQVVCQGGTTGDAWIEENLTSATRVPVDDVAAALTGVSTGLYDAMVVDLPVASYMLEQSFSDLTIVKEIPTGEQYGIAVSYDNPELKKAVNDALAEMESDGTMAQIKTTWFGGEI